MDANERRERASEDAAAWWLELSDGDLSRAKREEFIDWLRESSVHVAEMLRVAEVHDALESFERWARIATEDVEHNKSIVPFPVQRPNAATDANNSQIAASRRGWLWGIAAGVCAVAVALTWLMGDFRGQTIITARGEQRKVTLVDGSVLQVGPQTRLLVRFEEQERRIEFDRGATLFQVAKDARRPFIVEAERTVIRAVGTAFGVERREETGVVITVAEGRVAVNEAPGWHVPFVSGVPPKLPDIAVEAGHQIAVRRPGEIGEIRQVDSTRELAWAAGRLVFENASVSEVVKEFNRYNRVQLEVTDRTLARRPISATFDASDPEAFIAFVAAGAPVRIVRSSGRVITIAPALHDATEDSH